MNLDPHPLEDFSLPKPPTVNRRKLFENSIKRRKEYNLRKMQSKPPELKLTEEMKAAQATAFTQTFSTKAEAKEHAEKGWGPNWPKYIILSSPWDGATGYALIKRFKSL